MRGAKIGGTTAGAICALAIPCLLIVACSGRGGDALRHADRPPSTAASTGVSPVTTNTQKSQPSTQTAIQAIKDRYADVGKRLHSFRQVERELTGVSSEGGTLKAFFDGDILRVVQSTFYGETGRVDRAFYYDDSGRPFFVLERASRYEKPLSKVAGTREYRYYFHEGQLIRLLDGERQVSASSPEYASRVRTLLELSGRVADAARRP